MHGHLKGKGIGERIYRVFLAGFVVLRLRREGITGRI